MNGIISPMHDISSSNAPVSGWDSLTAMLHGLRLDGLDHGRRRLHGVWGYSFPSTERAYFHVVMEKPIWLCVDDHWSELAQGDAVLLPRGSAHLLASAPNGIAPQYPAWQCRPISEEEDASTSAEQQDASLLFYGSMQFNLDRSHPLLQAMPSVIHAGSLAQAEPAIMPLLHALAGEMTSRRVGAGGMAARLADVLAIQIIRSWVEQECDSAVGWIAAARDPRIGRALEAVHNRAEEDWTVGRLAAQAGMSRSSFAAAFTAIVGNTPHRYLSEVRMQQARLWISRDGTRITEVARRLHYDSDASFSRSFKRVVGKPPSFFRDR